MFVLTNKTGGDICFLGNKKLQIHGILVYLFANFSSLFAYF